MSLESITVNPFPFEAAVNLESISFREEELERVVLSPTSPLPHLFELREYCRAYLGRIPTREKRQGRCYLLQGENGSGKTHALGDALVRIASGQLSKPVGDKSSPVAPRAPIVLYCKVREESSSFVTLQKELLGRLTVDEWRGLGRDAMFMLATGNQAPEGDLIEQLLGKLIIDRGTLWKKQSEAMRPVGHRDDFTLAFSYFLGVELGRDTTLATAARNWLAGQEVSAEDQRKLGVQGPITKQEDAAQAIQFLITLCGLADRPLVLAVDQLEKLVIRCNTEESLEILGLLHSLVETAPLENTLLLLAGTNRAWEAFPPDLRRRVENNLIRCERLSLPLARNVIATYLNPSSRRDQASEADDQELHPFKPEAVRRMLECGGGSIRRLLQLASKGFEKSLNGEMVDAAMIDSIAQRSDVFRNDRGSARVAIETELRKRGSPFAADFKVSDCRADFAICGLDGTPRVIVAISESIHGMDEVSRATELLQLARAAGQSQTPPVLILVVAGYASPEVVKRLGEVPYRVIIYDPETFAEAFGAILDPITLTAPSSTVTGPVSADGSLEARIDQIQADLKTLARERGPIQIAIDAGLEAQGRRQAAPRLSQRRQEARRGWTQERGRLEDAISQAREKRAAAEIAELRRLRDKGEAARRETSDVWNLVLGILAFVGLVWCIAGYAKATIQAQSQDQDMVRLQSESDQAQVNYKSAFQPTPMDWNDSLSPNAETTSRSKDRMVAQLNLNRLIGSLKIAESTSRSARIAQEANLIWGSFPLLVMAFSVVRYLSIRHLLVDRTQRDLSKPVDSIAELDRLACAFIDNFKERLVLRPFLFKRLLSWTPDVRSRPRSVMDLLRDPSPHFRYAGELALGLTPELARHYISEVRPRRQVQQEPSSVLRRHFALMICGHGPLVSPEELRAIGDFAAQAYGLQAWMESAAVELDLPASENPSSKSLRALEKLLTAEGNDSQEALSALMSILFGADTETQPLVKAYIGGLERSDLSFLDNLTETQLLDGARIVSPLAAGGLGTLDHLKLIDRIDALFLITRELLFYKNWGDLITVAEVPQGGADMPAGH